VLAEAEAPRLDILVAGSLALDLSCDYAPLVQQIASKTQSPSMHTSNPAQITQTVGGVGYNVALAAHRAGSPLQVGLCSLVADDVLVALFSASCASSNR
jgi:pseudouridylate synthase / pseudouridine kinase